MLSKAKIKLIRSLEQKKKRREEALFVAEGPKVVGDLLPYFPCHLVVATDSWLTAHADVQADEVISATQDELCKASFLKTPQDVLALFRLPAEEAPLMQPKDELCLALDDVQDPGNLGTIIRLADWFGIRHLFCSRGTADAFAPKTIQATMGAIARVHVHYVDLPSMLTQLHATHPDVPVYGTFLEGRTIYDEALSSNGLIIMGNEGNGISATIGSYVTHKLYIPSYPQGCPTSESLNVAIATAITCSEFRRRQ